MDAITPHLIWSPSSAPDPVRVRIWLNDLDALPDEVHEIPLATEEHAHARRLRSALQRRRYVARCRFLRMTLGRVCGLAPESLRFAVDARGKPCLDGPRDPIVAALRFSLAHASNLLALAVCSGRELGVDLEFVDESIDPLRVGATVLPRARLDALEALPPDRARREFYSQWTQHEAIAKADGRGLTTPLADGSEHGWSVHPFDHAVGDRMVVGAVAVAKQPLARAAMADLPPVAPWGPPAMESAAS
jgi:phosphopantetheinyl transferase